MSVTGTPSPSAAGALTAADVRNFIRDYTENNILLDQVEFTDADITKAMEFAVSEYNILPPPVTNVTSDGINPWLLLMGTVCHLLRSESFLQLRNQATYQTSGMPQAGIDTKYPDYMRLEQSLRTDWREAVTRVKQSINMASFTGEVNSEYYYIGRFQRWN